ncbi:hypothetical protein ANCCAN_08578 [Ancylostoma caninum]|uniref:Uncharacterized protein n=1 Tax=Ancylostoma caninum TaxID=29170 RepID=A0A368GP66_ANCCA|nr:hypothetical protein ANCCAN_08578 [Ancylostoma caninum]
MKRSNILSVHILVQHVRKESMGTSFSINTWDRTLYEPTETRQGRFFLSKMHIEELIHQQVDDKCTDAVSMQWTASPKKSPEHFYSLALYAC